MRDLPQPTPDSQEIERLLGETTWLRALAQRLVGREDADDLCQDAAVAALSRPPHQPAGLGAWLFGVMRNLATQRRRAGARQRSREQRAARDESLPAASELVAQVQMQRRVVDAVLAVPEPYRTTLLERFWENRTPAQIADAAGVPVETVRTHIKRGLAMVRTRLDRACGARAAWVTPLMAFATGRPVEVTVTSATLAGVVMATQSKAAIGISVALILAFGTWWLAKHVDHLPEVDVARATSPPDITAQSSAATPMAQPKDVDAARQLADVAPLLTITGQLVDELTLAPITSGELRLSRADLPLPQTTMSRALVAGDGSFKITTADAMTARFPDLWVHVADRAAVRPSLPGHHGTAPTIDLGRVLVPPGTGLRGLVVDERGARVAAAEVLVTTRTWWSNPTWSNHAGHAAAGVLLDLLPLAVTDAAGHFAASERILPYSDPTYLVAISPRGIGYARIDATRARRDLEVTVPLCATTKLTVSVRNHEGQAVAGARVSTVPRFAPLGGRGMPAARVHPSAQTLFSSSTDQDGRAMLDLLPIGGTGRAEDLDYDVEVTAPPHRPQLRNVRLEHPRATELVIELPRGELAISGTVRDERTTPVPGAEVQIEGTTATTDPQGRYTLAAVPIRRLMVSSVVSARGHTTLHQTLPSPTTDETTLDFVLTRVGELRGQALDQHGKPIVGAQVFVNSAAVASTDAEGLFTLQCQASGESTLVVMPPAPLDDWEPVYPRQVRLTDSPITWTLTRRTAGIAQVRVEVVDAGSGAPADAEGELFPAGPDDHRRGPPLQSAESRLGLRRYVGVREGRYLLTVGTRFRRVITVAPDQPDIVVRAELRPPGTIEGELVLDDLPRAEWPERVTLWFGPTQESARFLPPEGGRSTGATAALRTIELSPAIARRFALEDVDPYVPLTLTAMASGLLAVARVTLPASGRATAQLRLQIAGNLLLVSDQAPARGFVQLRWRRTTDLQFDHAADLPLMPDEQGRAHARLPMLPGTYRWQTRWLTADDEQRELEGEVTVKPRATAQVRLDLTAGAAVR